MPLLLFAEEHKRKVSEYRKKLAELKKKEEDDELEARHPRNEEEALWRIFRLSTENWLLMPFITLNYQ